MSENKNRSKDETRSEIYNSPVKAQQMSLFNFYLLQSLNVCSKTRDAGPQLTVFFIKLLQPVEK